MSWLTVFGVRGDSKGVGTIELVTAALLVIASCIAVASALGAAMASGTLC
jgi:hypothetical protein